MVSVPSLGVIGKSALEIGQFLRQNFWVISGGRFLSRPLCFTADSNMVAAGSIAIAPLADFTPSPNTQALGDYRARKRHINFEHINFLKVGTTLGQPAG